MTMYSWRGDVAALSEAALDGVECVVCGLSYIEGDPVPHVPVGIVDGGQLFACSSHQEGSSR